MLGTLRFALAILVVISHLWQKPYWLGSYAVFSFYMISGYLMTLIMNRKYGFNRDGIGRFALNRILRIYPPYYIAVLLTVALIALIGADAVRTFKEPMHLPTAPSEIAGNLLLITLDPSSGSRLVPPAWALGVELVFYALIAAGLGRTRAIVLGWFGVSLILCAYLLLSGADFDTRYFTLSAASLPFSMGALLFHFRAEITAALRSVNLYGALFLYLALLGAPALQKLLIADFTPLMHPQGFYFYANIPISFVLIAKLIDIRKLPLISRKFDEQLGNLSYPIYLIHWQIGLIAAWILLQDNRPGLPLLMTSLPLILLAAMAINRWVEQPIERLRTKIAQDADTPTATTERAPG